MAGHARHLLVSLFVLFAMPLHVAADEEAVPPVVHTVEGKHFRILCRFDGETHARRALAVAEAAWRPTVEVTGIEPKLENKIEIHLMRHPADYRAVEKTITNGTFAKSNAFASWDTRSAYIALEPTMADELLARAGITAQSRRSIAHEAAHLIVYRAWPQYRYHPNWLAEGVAIWAADQAMVPANTHRALGSRPFSGRRLVDLARFAREGKIPAIKDVLKNKYGELDFYGRYAFWWGFWRYLYLDGPDKKGFRKVLAGMAKRTNGGAFRGELLTAMTKLLADEDGSFADFEKRFTEWAKGLKAEWDEPNRMLDIRRSGWWQLGFEDSNALCWRTARVRRQTYSVRGSFEMLTPDEPQMNVLLGREDSGFVSVAFRADQGVTVFRFHEEGDRWENLAFGRARNIKVGRRHRFTVRVAGNTLKVFLDRKEVVSAEVGSHAMDGPWGVGVQAGAAGIWRGVRVAR